MWYLNLMKSWWWMQLGDQAMASQNIQSCRRVLLDLETNFTVGFNRRQANKIAHALAKASRFHVTWFEPPTCIGFLYTCLLY